ncbi:MAG: hypothetical protein BIFFINMI_01667 [Phycisphaerae bacterium]|nr:hypothetical protein [Phycisphaerae bacterium]
MAIDKPNEDRPAQATPGDGAKKDFSLGQRFGVGLNVAVMIVAAAALVVLANWIASLPRLRVREDLSSLQRYSLSQRTRQVLGDVKDPVTLTILYDSQKEGYLRKDYQPRLLDLADEMKLAGHGVTVNDVEGPAGRAELIRRIEEREGGTPAKLRAFVLRYQEVQKTVAQELKNERTSLRDLASDRKSSWAAPFRQLGTISRDLAKAIETLNEATGEVDRLASEDQSLPYGQQVEAIGKGLADTLENLRAAQPPVGDLAALAAKMKDDKVVVPQTKAHAAAVDKLFGEVKDLVSKAGNQPADDALIALARQIADRYAKVAAELRAEAMLLRTFMEDQPALEWRSGWCDSPELAAAGMRVPFIYDHIGDEAQGLAEMAQQIEGIIQNAKIEVLRQFLYQNIVPESVRGRQRYATLFDGLADEVGSMAKVDEQSKRLLDQAKDYPTAPTEALKALKDACDKLPKLKYPELLGKLKEQNLVLLEVGDQAPRLLTFDEVWPPISMGGPDADAKEVRRSFNGDSVIGSSLLSLVHAPFAEVVIVHFRMPMSQPGMPPQQAAEADMRMNEEIKGLDGDLALSWLLDLQTLRKRLESANLKVTDWNLATEDAPPPPASADDKEGAQPTTDTAEDALPRIYLVPPLPPSEVFGPFGQAPPEKIEALTHVLDEAAGVIFPATFYYPRYGPSTPYPMSPTYGWNEYLKKTWGLEARTAYRIVQGVPLKEEGRFGVSWMLWRWMRMSHFTDHPIGKPLQSRRVLLTDVCPVRTTDEPPAGVSYQTVLDVPVSARGYWATSDPRNIMMQFQSNAGGSVKLGSDDLKPPLAAMIAATREADQAKGTKAAKVVLFGGGASLTDGFLGQRTLERGEEGQDTTGPAPEVDAEIIVNSVYWLAGQSSQIATGPVSVPVIEEMPARTRGLVGWVVWIVCPAVVLVLGMGVVLMRRSA